MTCSPVIACKEGIITWLVGLTFCGLFYLFPQTADCRFFDARCETGLFFPKSVFGSNQNCQTLFNKIKIKWMQKTVLVYYFVNRNFRNAAKQWALPGRGGWKYISTSVDCEFLIIEYRNNITTVPPHTALCSPPPPQSRRPISSPKYGFSWLYTSGSRIQPLLRQSRDQWYWEGQLYCHKFTQLNMRLYSTCPVLPKYKVVRSEAGPVTASSYGIHCTWFKIDYHCPWHIPGECWMLDVSFCFGYVLIQF